MAEPRNANPIAHREVAYAGAKFIDVADDFMPGDNRQFGIGEFAINDMKIGPAYAAGGDTEADFARTGTAFGDFAREERRAWASQHHRPHGDYTGPTATT